MPVSSLVSVLLVITGTLAILYLISVHSITLQVFILSYYKPGPLQPSHILLGVFFNYSTARLKNLVLSD